MRIWMLPAPTGGISISDLQLLLIGIELSSENPPVVLDNAYVSRYLWDTN